jgi:hypothetical protein
MIDNGINDFAKPFCLVLNRAMSLQSQGELPMHPLTEFVPYTVCGNEHGLTGQETQYPEEGRAKLTLWNGISPVPSMLIGSSTQGDTKPRCHARSGTRDEDGGFEGILLWDSLLSGYANLKLLG